MTDASRRILCVDDDALLLEGLRRQVRKDFDVTTAVGPEQALEAVRSNGPFAVIVADFNMPGMNGIELLSRVREISPDTVGIMLTGRAELDIAVSALHFGRVYRFLTKPCPREVLGQVMRDALEQYRLITSERELTARLGQANATLQELNSGLELQVAARTQSLRSLLEFMSDLNGLDTIADIVRLIVDRAASMLCSRRAVVLLHDGRLGGMRIAASAGTELSLTEQALAGYSPIARAVWERNASIVLNQCDAHCRLTDEADIALFGTLPCGCSALPTPQGPVGVLAVSGRLNDAPYAEEDSAELKALADAAGMAILNQLRRDERDDARDAVIMALARLAEHRDPETGAHLERVQRYCRLLAEKLGRTPQWAGEIDAAFITDLVRSSPLHDIGKVGVPDHILLKPGKLTPEEFEIMKRHTTIGGDTIRSLIDEGRSQGFLRMGMEIAYAHHEKFDGSGYPKGLAGAAIPLPARIVAVADVYDALTSARVYKAAFSHEKACEIIREGSGSHFDPAIVDAFDSIKADFDQVRESLADAAGVASAASAPQAPSSTAPATPASPAPLEPAIPPPSTEGGPPDQRTTTAVPGPARNRAVALP